MNYRWKHSTVGLCAVLLAAGVLSVSAFQQGNSVPKIGAGTQSTGVQPPAADPAVKVKLDYEQNIKDAARLAQLSAEVKRELESGNEFTLSAATLKKSEELEKLSKKLHDRMRSDNAPASNLTRIPGVSPAAGR